MPVPEKKRVNPVIVWGGILLLIVVLIFGIRSLTRESVEVRVASTSYQNLVSSVSTNGKVELIHQFQAHAAVPGQIEKLYVEVGDTVKPGEMLVKMNDADIRARISTAEVSVDNAKVGLDTVQKNGTQEERLGMEGDIDRAKLQQQQAAADVAKLQQLQQRGSASAGEVRSAQERLDSANSTLKSMLARSTGRFSSDEQARARKQVADAEAGRAAALSSFAGANITSPISGTVYSVPISQYDYVSAGEELVDVADLNQVQVMAYFDEPEVGKLANGQTVTIKWEAKPNMVWHGHVYQVPTTIINYGGTRSVGECIIRVDDARGDLQPNANVTVTVKLREDDNVLSIPREALHTDGPENYVYRVVNKTLVRTSVQIGAATNLTRAEITSGLGIKDIVALNALNNLDLKDGLAVKPVR